MKKKQVFGVQKIGAKLLFSRLREGFAFITILAVIVTAYWQNFQTASGATFIM